MVKVPRELKANYIAFSQKLPKIIDTNSASFRNKSKLIESYARIAALNALKVDLVSPSFDPDAAQFYYEAHNDALVSHVNASFGSWRPALQALRSFLENSLAAIYYSDHPVELAKWKQGSFRISPRELREYIVAHPKVAVVSNELDLKTLLDDEYSTLSKAVHGSNSLFRMTDVAGNTNFADANNADLGKWSARERMAVDLCTVMFVSIFQDSLDGAKLPELRKSLSFSLQTKSRSAIKKHLKIHVAAPT